MRILQSLILVLALAVTSFAQYDVRIEQDTAVNIGQFTTISVTINPQDSAYELGGFDLELSYENLRLTFMGATPGSFLTGCGWEYFTWRSNYGYPPCCNLCPGIGLIELISVANLGGGSTPSCYSATQPAEIARLSFQASGDENLEGVTSPLNFYRRADINYCAINSFSSRDGNKTYAANHVYDAFGVEFDTVFNCDAPPASCGNLYREFDFYSGKVKFVIEDTSDRGDLNLNGIKYEIGDRVLYTNYFIYGAGVFSTDSVQRARQLVASEINCDGLILTVADLVYMIRVMNGSIPPGPGCYAQAPKQDNLPPAASSAVGDTLAFPNASGYAAQQRVAFNVKVANGQTLSGLQARITYDPATLSPHFDAAIGDGQSIEYTALGRAAGYDANGTIKVFSSQPGVVIVRFFPDPGTGGSTISTGTGNILKFNMDVSTSAPTPSSTPVQFVTAGYEYNLFANQFGYALFPTIVNGTFNVIDVPPPPSCPVLYTFDGYQFVEEDALLTACEASGYKDAVTDYYHIGVLPQIVDGKVSFQIKELEDEITYLDNLQLLTVDHSRSTKVACDVTGKIFAYCDNGVPPLTGIDQSGNDILDKVLAKDGVIFTSTESGHMILEFPNNGGGFEVNTAKKQICYEKITLEAQNPKNSGIKIEILDDMGEWVEFPTIPSRENSTSEVVMNTAPESITSEIIKLRISWIGGYSTDVIRQLIPSEEKPVITNWAPKEFDLANAESSMRWAGFQSDGALVLRRGDTFDFRFESGQPIGRGQIRDYVIVAAGRFEPDYSVYGNLLPNTATLFPNYPNPFNPKTVISYSLPEAGYVTLEVFNILGQKVDILADGMQSAGLHKVEWPVNNIAAITSGVY
ncbi:MAG TPA: cohesin domain-containing protein, partial [candidate division Zixibacteria bacterium]|nr:cohesin domain-containing protein [candidate division Zixibacteria bacterium]